MQYAGLSRHFLLAIPRTFFHYKMLFDIELDIDPKNAKWDYSLIRHESK